MKFEVKGHTVLVCESQPTTAGFLKSFDDLYPEIKAKNIIISLLDFQSLDLFFFDRCGQVLLNIITSPIFKLITLSSLFLMY